MVDYIGSDPTSKKLFFIQASAIAGMNLSLNQQAHFMLNMLAESLGVNEQDLAGFVKAGQDLSFALNVFGVVYSSANRAKVILPKMGGAKS